MNGTVHILPRIRARGRGEAYGKGAVSKTDGSGLRRLPQFRQVERQVLVAMQAWSNGGSPSASHCSGEGWRPMIRSRKRDRSSACVHEETTPVAAYLVLLEEVAS
jgi:hypothetical protein